MSENLKNDTKYGNIFKVSYNPEVSVSLKSFCKRYVREENQNDDTSQYLIEEIFIQAEGLKYKILPEDVEIFDWLNKEGVEFIEI